MYCSKNIFIDCDSTAFNSFFSSTSGKLREKTGMGKKELKAALSEERLGFSASHNNSWYSNSSPGPDERRDVLLTGSFPSVRVPFKRSPTLLDSWDKSRDVAKTSERYVYMASCTDVINRDWDLRFAARASRDASAGNYPVLPQPQYASDRDAAGKRCSNGFRPQQPRSLCIAKGVPQQTGGGLSRFSVQQLPGTQ
jgi:hypothetical protein